MVISCEDGVSGIRLYRLLLEVDEVTLIGGLLGIEMIRFGHCYVVVFSSIHSQIGKAYCWLIILGMECGILMFVDLFEFFRAWCDALVKIFTNVFERFVVVLILSVNRGICKVVSWWLLEALRGMELGVSRHDVVIREFLRAVRFEEMGYDIVREIDIFGLVFICSISKNKNNDKRTTTTE
jgi:hypothetical protein